MRDDWVGDEADFLKYGLLRAVCRMAGPHHPLGVVWYYRPGTTSSRSVPPARPTPLKWRPLEPALFDHLAGLHARHRRHLSAILEEEVLPPQTTVHFDEPMWLPGGSGNAAVRRGWHARALKTTHSCRTVFLDPDNGIQPDCGAKSNYTKPRLAHVLWEEMGDYWGRGQSLIVFQHAARRRNAVEESVSRVNGMLPGISALHVVKRGPRWLIIMAQPDHAATLTTALHTFLAHWSGFIEIDLPGTGLHLGPGQVAR